MVLQFGNRGANSRRSGQFDLKTLLSSPVPSTAIWLVINVPGKGRVLTITHDLSKTTSKHSLSENVHRKL